MSSSQPPNSAPPPSSTPPPPSNSTSPPPEPLSTPSPPSTAPPPTEAISPPSPSLPLIPSPPSSSTQLNNPSGPSGSGKRTPSSGRSHSSSSSSSTSMGLMVGLAIGGVVIILLLCFSWICCCRKKRRPGPTPQQYYIAPPSRKDESNEQHQNWHNCAPKADHAIKIPPNPAPPPTFPSRPPLVPGNFGAPPSVTSGSFGLNYSGSDNSPVPPSPTPSLGLSKSTFTYEELAIATDGFSEANLLGQGGFGYVHRGMLPSGKEIAVKQLKSGSGQGEREFQAEVEIISRVHHRYLVSLVGFCIAEGKRLLVYEFVPNNTLEFHLHGRGRPPLDWPTRLKVALGSAKGLAYLHEDCHPKIIHRDIKASNILLDFKFEAKVADFGLAKSAPETNTHVSTRVMGTFGYLAPEYASSGKLTEKSDVFSFGVMLLELITGRPPFDSSQSFMDDSLVDWARPMLSRALDDGSFDSLVDPRLGKDYNHNEMRRMIACAAASVRHSARRRPRMSQIVRALEGDISFEGLNGVKAGYSSAYGSYASSDYDAMQYNEDMRKFRKMALASEEYGNIGYSPPTSDHGLGLIQSGSSGESWKSRDLGEIDTCRVKKESREF